MDNTNTNTKGSSTSNYKGSSSSSKDKRPALSTVRTTEAAPTSGRGRVDNRSSVVAEESSAQIPDGAPPARDVELDSHCVGDYSTVRVVSVVCSPEAIFVEGGHLLLYFICGCCRRPSSRDDRVL